MKYADLTWKEVGEALANRWLILPIGSVEQHGPHLPFAVDASLAELFSTKVAERVEGVVAPTLWYGARSLPNSGGGHRYPGTVHLSGEVLLRVYREIITGFVRAGAGKLLLLNGHWENEGLLLEAVDGCREAGLLGGADVVALSWWSVVEARDMTDIFTEFPGWHAEHAGQAETALMLAFYGDRVHMDRAVDHRERVPAGIYRHPTPETWSGTDGVLSPTTHTTAEHGERLASLVVDRLASLLER
ncbi:MAG: creatininase family protein [Myxococcota bacterium]